MRLIDADAIKYNYLMFPETNDPAKMAVSKDKIDAAETVPAIPVSWIEAKIELVNSLPGVSMLKMKTADWRDLVEQWKAEQRSPGVDHDAQIREFAEEMSKHGVT